MKRQEPNVKFQKKERRNTIDLGAFGGKRRRVPMRLYGKCNWPRSER